MNTEYEQAIRKAYERGRQVGRIEGMITYQEHLVENLRKENAILVDELKIRKGNNHEKR